MEPWVYQYRVLLGYWYFINIDSHLHKPEPHMDQWQTGCSCLLNSNLPCSVSKDTEWRMAGQWHGVILVIFVARHQWYHDVSQPIASSLELSSVPLSNLCGLPFRPNYKALSAGLTVLHWGVLGTVRHVGCLIIPCTSPQKATLDKHTL